MRMGLSRLRRTKPNSEDEDGGDLLHDASWLYSYGDLVTQLLLFIILTVTFSGMLQKEETPKARAPETLAEAHRELAEYIAKSKLDGDVMVDLSEDRVVLRVKSVLLFGSGTAALTPKAREVLVDLARYMRDAPFDLRVDGHTDNVPINTPQYPSNWELSAARAIAVVQFFEGHDIAASRLAAAGYGEFRPIVANDTDERRAQNRRVEIVIQGGG